MREEQIASLDHPLANVIELNGSLDVTQRWTVADGPGTDLEVWGTLTSSNRTTFSGGASAMFHNGSVANIGNNVRLSPEGKPDMFEQGDVIVRDGVLIVLKGGVVPDGTVI